MGNTWVNIKDCVNLSYLKLYKGIVLLGGTHCLVYNSDKHSVYDDNGTMDEGGYGVPEGGLLCFTRRK